MELSLQPSRVRPNHLAHQQFAFSSDFSLMAYEYIVGISTSGDSKIGVHSNSMGPAADTVDAIGISLFSAGALKKINSTCNSAKSKGVLKHLCYPIDLQSQKYFYLLKELHVLVFYLSSTVCTPSSLSVFLFLSAEFPEPLKISPTDSISLIRLRSSSLVQFALRDLSS